MSSESTGAATGRALKRARSASGEVDHGDTWWLRCCCQRRRREDVASSPPGDLDAPRPSASTSSRRSQRRALVDLNSASLDVLKELPGIGAKRAIGIQELCATKPLASLHDLGCLPGIGASTVERIGRFAFVDPELGLQSAAGVEDRDADLRRCCGQLLVGSWNVRNLGRKALETDRAAEVVSVIAEYDVIALLELRDSEVVDGLLQLLGKEKWSAVFSPLVGTTHHKEVYAFLYRPKAAQLLNSSLLDDPNDKWVREPFLAQFRTTQGFDFVAAAVHIVWGDTAKERRKEVEALGKKLQQVQSWSGEGDVLLMGDFNVEPSDGAWGIARSAGWVPLLEKDGLKSMVGDTHLYDNIWVHSSNTANSEWLGASGAICFDKVLNFGTGSEATKKAIKELSDHRPIWAIFASDVDDDEGREQDQPLFRC